ncbi:MAG: tRNA (adenosine(37)-N6)-threonylcarbamoyltransferase complex ATPase subunit type 1 TsaE [Daejeonella sp.]
MKIQITDLRELPDAAEKILEFSQQEKIFLFEGGMGAGKTTLIKDVCRQLGSDELVSSPTYSIVNEYSYPKGKIFHFDFFRIKSEAEAFDIGFEEYLYSGHYCFIEWPEKIQSLWPLQYITVSIDQSEDQLRLIRVTRT